MALLNVFLICFSALPFAELSTLPSEKCNVQDSTCLVATAKKFLPIFADGIPELGIDQLDELKFDKVDFNLSGLEFSLSDGKLKGFKNSVIDDLKWDVSKKRISISIHVDCDIEGHYTASGKLLTVPISGDGLMYLNLKKYVLIIDMDYELKNVDGKDFSIIKKYEFKYEVINNAHFRLTNLFNGNEELSNSMLTLINDNWKELIDEFGRPFVDVVVKKLVRNVGQFFKKNALSDIANVN